MPRRCLTKEHTCRSFDMEKFARISPPSSLCQGLFDALGVRPGALVCSYDSSEPGRDFVGAQDARSTAPQSLWTVDFARAPLPRST